VAASGAGLSAEESRDLANDAVHQPRERGPIEDGNCPQGVLPSLPWKTRLTVALTLLSCLTTSTSGLAVGSAGLPTTSTSDREPVPGCCTLRQTESGDFRADDADRPGTPPFTTIAWRLWHLIQNYGAKRQPEWLGVERPPGGFERDDAAPATAAEAIAVLARAHDFWQDLLRELPAVTWWEPLGPIAGEYAESSKAALVLHHIDEQIHHGAELGVLRDLYLHDAANPD
jgi:DinB superfamily